MDFTYGSALAIALVPAIGALLIGLFFSGKLKIVRYIFWSLSAVFLLLAISMIIKHSKHTNEMSLKLTGSYKVDLENSKYQNDTLHNFSDLILKVNKDGTFAFNRTTPFFSSNSGKWTFDVDIFVTECSFDGINRSFQIVDGIKTWTFPDYALKNYNSGDQISFSRVVQN